MARAKYQELMNLIANAPISANAKDHFADVLMGAVDLMDDRREGVQLLHVHRDGEEARKRVERLFIRAIWRGRLIEVIESEGATPQNLNVFTRLLHGIRQLEAFYPELA